MLHGRNNFPQETPTPRRFDALLLTMYLAVGLSRAVEIRIKISDI